MEGAARRVDGGACCGGKDQPLLCTAGRSGRGRQGEAEDPASRSGALAGGAAGGHAGGVGGGNALELDQPAERASGAGSVGSTAAEDAADVCRQTEERSPGCGETGAHGAAGSELHGTDPAPPCGAAGRPGGDPGAGCAGAGADATDQHGAGIGEGYGGTVEGMFGAKLCAASGGADSAAMAWGVAAVGVADPVMERAERAIRRGGRETGAKEISRDRAAAAGERSGTGAMAGVRADGGGSVAVPAQPGRGAVPGVGAGAG